MVRPRREGVTIDVPTTPLIDVVFLLLTFFIFALVLTVRVDVLDIDLPRSGVAAAGDTGAGESVVLVVLPDGGLMLDGSVVAVGGLGAALEGAGVVGGADGGVGLKIAVDASTPTSVLFDVVERLGELGVSGLRFLRVPSDGGADAGGAEEVGGGDG